MCERHRVIRCSICGQVLVLLLCCWTTAASGETPTRLHPSITDVIEMPRLVEDALGVSPDGTRIAYVLERPDWQENRYRRECVVASRRAGETRHLTEAGSIRNLRWLDDRRLALVQDEQIWIYNVPTGTGTQVTALAVGVEAFELLRGRWLVLLAYDPARDPQRQREERLGTFAHTGRDGGGMAVFTVDLREVPPAEHEQASETFSGERVEPPEPIDLTATLGAQWDIQSLVASPAGDAVYVNCLPAGDMAFWKRSAVFRLAVAASQGGSLETGSWTRLELPPALELAAVSPDGGRALARCKGDAPRIFDPDGLVLVRFDDQGGVEIGRNLTGGLDRHVIGVAWTRRGVVITTWDGTRVQLGLLSEDGALRRVNLGRLSPRRLFSASVDGQIGFIAGDARHLDEVFVVAIDHHGSATGPIQVSDLAAARPPWDWGTAETVRWTSSDGHAIEGVLRRPSTFAEGRPYPLLFMVHGGPTWADVECLEERYELRYYPVVQLLRAGVLVLRPNYRGSRGYGAAFAAAKSGRSMGIASLADLEGAIDALSSQGLIDETRVGCMGWSHGGYISAFVATRSGRFRAVSVGAGISDWTSYAVHNPMNLEIAREYLGTDPFDDPHGVYGEADPIGPRGNRGVPMLIQHGASDPIAPFLGARMLYYAMRACGVPVELIAYPTMGHGITSPRENRAVMQQNLAWFCHYLLGGELELVPAAGGR